MPYGISLHIGVDYLDHKRYGFTGALPFCSNDAKAMQLLANNCGFTSSLMLNTEAITIDFLYFLDKTATFLSAGDILFISFSGHGSQQRDLNGDEDDGMDETLCFYDRELVDDELVEKWKRFKRGVRILFISDSCHSGTVTKDILEKSKFAHATKHLHYIPNDLYIEASVLLLSACQDFECASGKARKGIKLSRFSAELLDSWNNGLFSGNYKSFMQLIERKLPLTQQANYYLVGKENIEFENQKPFTI